MKRYECKSLKDCEKYVFSLSLNKGYHQDNRIFKLFLSPNDEKEGVKYVSINEMLEMIRKTSDEQLNGFKPIVATCDIAWNCFLCDEENPRSHTQRMWLIPSQKDIDWSTAYRAGKEFLLKEMKNNIDYWKTRDIVLLGYDREVPDAFVERQVIWDSSKIRNAPTEKVALVAYHIIEHNAYFDEACNLADKKLYQD